MANHGGAPNLIVKDPRGLRPPGVASQEKTSFSKVGIFAVLGESCKIQWLYVIMHLRCHVSRLHTLHTHNFDAILLDCKQIFLWKTGMNLLDFSKFNASLAMILSLINQGCNGLLVMQWTLFNTIWPKASQLMFKWSQSLIWPVDIPLQYMQAMQVKQKPAAGTWCPTLTRNS